MRLYSSKTRLSCGIVVGLAQGLWEEWDKEQWGKYGSSCSDGDGLLGVNRNRRRGDGKILKEAEGQKYGVDRIVLDIVCAYSYNNLQSLMWLCHLTSDVNLIQQDSYKIHLLEIEMDLNKLRCEIKLFEQHRFLIQKCSQYINEKQQLQIDYSRQSLSKSLLFQLYILMNKIIVLMLIIYEVTVQIRNSFNNVFTKQIQHFSTNMQKEQKQKQTTETQNSGELDSFQKFGLNENIIKGIYSYGLTKPSLVQQKAIPPLIKGGDMIVQAESGSGKTMCMMIGVLQRIDLNNSQLQALVLTPNRELAQCLHHAMKCLAQYLKISSIALTGGTNIIEDKKRLKEGGIQLIIGTPGRVMSQISKQRVNVDNLNMLVLQQADEIVASSYFDDFKNIINYCSADTQIVFFLNTLPPQIQQFSQKYLNKPELIIIKPQKFIRLMQQYFIQKDEEQQKQQFLVELCKSIKSTQCIIYANTNERMNKLITLLTKRGLSASCLLANPNRHQQLQLFDQCKRYSLGTIITMEQFVKEPYIPPFADLIINYDLPLEVQSYFFRLGRGSKFETKGITVNFVNASNIDFLDKVGKQYSCQIDPLPSNLDNLNQFIKKG